MTKEKGKQGQSRVTTYWHGLQARSLALCIALLLVMTVHAILLIYLERSATDDFTIYLDHTQRLLPLWSMGVLIFALIYATYRFRAGSILIVSCLVYIVVTIALVLPLISQFMDMTRIDDHVYYLEIRGTYEGVGFNPGPSNDEPICCATRQYRLYECDSIGLICRVIADMDYVRDTIDPSGYLHVDSDTHTIAIIVFDEIIYAYPEGDS